MSADQEKPLGLYEVLYSITGVIPMRAWSEGDASGRVLELMIQWLRNARGEGLTARQVQRACLWQAEVDVEGVITTDQPVPARLTEADGSREPDIQKEFFEITRVSREDLERVGFATGQVTDADMRRLAGMMANDYVEQLFWTSLALMAESLGFPRRSSANRSLASPTE